jgi:hypothetical protein
MMTREPPRSHRWRRPRRPLTAVVLAGALVAAGCGYREHEGTAADRKLCDQIARQAAASPGSERYEGIYDACIRNLQHPERGGG